jgi:hypothetical protein
MPTFTGALTAAGINAVNATTTNLAVTGTGYFAGNIGIDTTSPSVLLTIDSASTNGTILRLSNASTGGHIFDISFDRGGCRPRIRQRQAAGRGACGKRAVRRCIVDGIDRIFVGSRPDNTGN